MFLVLFFKALQDLLHIWCVCMLFQIFLFKLTLLNMRWGVCVYSATSHICRQMLCLRYYSAILDIASDSRRLYRALTKLSGMGQCLSVLVETQQRGKGKSQFRTLSPFQYIMLARGILWAAATIIASLSPVLCFSSSLYPSYHTVFSLLDSGVFVCVHCHICSIPAQHVSHV